MIDVGVIETSSLGDRSYLASDGEVAVVVDPQRDVDRVLVLAGRLGVRISHVVETHVHNDYVSGGLELARLTGACCMMSAADDPAFGRVGVADGEVLEFSARLQLRVLATPGHTFHHLSYVLAGAAVGLLGAGGSILAVPALVYGVGQPLPAALAAALAAGRVANRLPAAALRRGFAVLILAAAVTAAAPFAPTALTTG